MPEFRRWRTATALGRYWPACATLCAGLALTAGLTAFMVHTDRARSARVFEEEAARLAARVEAYMNMLASIMAAGAGLFDASQHVSRAEWHAFSNALKRDRNVSIVTGIGFSERMPPGLSLSEAESRVAAARGEPVFIRPATPRREVHATVYLEPEDAVNRQAIGFDMYSEPLRRAAMEAAAVAAQMRISAPVALRELQPGTQVQSGVPMFHPLYWKGHKHDTASERRAALRGFVYAPLHMHESMRAVLLPAAPKFDFTLADRDAPAASASALPTHQGARPQAADQRAMRSSRQSIAFGGRVWEIHAAAPSRHDGETDLRREVALALGGTLTTLLAMALVGLVLRTRERAEHLASVMTRDLKVGRSRFERMMSGSAGGAWELDVASGAC